MAGNDIRGCRRIDRQGGNHNDPSITDLFYIQKWKISSKPLTDTELGRRPRYGDDGFSFIIAIDTA